MNSKKKAVTNKNTPTKRKKSKLTEGMGYTFWRQIPVSKAVIETLAEELVSEAQKDSSLTIASFLRKKGIDPMTFYNWAKKYPILGNALDIAKYYIGDNREIGALTRKLDANMVRASMPIYSKEWEKLEEWRAELRKKEDNDKNATINVIMPEVERVIKNEKEKK